MDQKVYDAGMKMRRKVAGDEYVDKAMSNLTDFNRDFQRIVTQYCWGEAWGDDTLTPRERSILNLGMIAALGKMEEFQTPCTIDVSPVNEAIASVSVRCTDGTLSCHCQPENGVPSYSMVIL